MIEGVIDFIQSDQGFYILGGAGGAALFLGSAIKGFKLHHFMFRVIAYRQLKKLAGLNDDRPKQYYLLRSTNPFVFEEMILNAFKSKGHKIIRNKRYTGDGGIDGQVYLDGQRHFIQAKRYRKHINPAHVREFGKVCRDHKVGGLFVHTGKTGPMSKTQAQEQNIKIISGDKLFKLLLPEKP